MARLTDLTPDLQEKILALVRLGVHPQVAAQAFGVAKPTYYQWIARGELRGPPDRPAAVPAYIEFVDRVQAAEAEAEATLVALAVTKARNTADAMMILARRYGERWRERLELRVEVEAILERMVADPEERAAAVAEVERLMRDGVRA